jgi:hypothetical protein
MPNKYFKAHEAYNLNPHRYDIGNIIGLKNGYEDNLFIKKLFALLEPEYPDFYQYHLDYFLGKEPDAEEEFFTFVWQIVLRRINFIEHKNPFNSSHALDMEILEKLTTFQRYLRSIDQWHTQKTLPEIIADQYEEIRNQQSKIELLKEELRIAKKLETKQYIDIPKGHLLTVYDIFNQLIDLKIKDEKLMVTKFPIVWVKIICKYFRVDKKELDMERVRSYFPKDRDNPGERSRLVPMDQKIFEIKTKKR